VRAHVTQPEKSVCSSGEQLARLTGGSLRVNTTSLRVNTTYASAPGGALRVELSSDEQTSASGFVASWSVVSCGSAAAGGEVAGDPQLLPTRAPSDGGRECWAIPHSQVIQRSIGCVAAAVAAGGVLLVLSLCVLAACCLFRRSRGLTEGGGSDKGGAGHALGGELALAAADPKLEAKHCDAVAALREVMPLPY
jgi:hypothetical protein